MGERGGGALSLFRFHLSPFLPFFPETPDAQATRSPPREAKKFRVGG